MNKKKCTCPNILHHPGNAGGASTGKYKCKCLKGEIEVEELEVDKKLDKELRN